MRTVIGFLVLAVSVLAAQPARAQDGPRIELTGFPGGGLFFTSSDRGEPDFSNLALGGAIAVNLNRFLAVEGEFTGAIGLDQRLDGLGSATTPSIATYQGNVVYNIGGNDRTFVPYATGGIGGLTLFDKRAVGVDDTTTFFTGNVGGGVKYSWGRWGLRGDYRLFAVNSKDDAPAFFGGENRIGHRVYGGVVVALR
jgi:hypothetical protein